MESKLFAGWVILNAFFVFYWFGSKSNFSKYSFRIRNIIKVSNSLDPDQADILSGLIWV